MTRKPPAPTGEPSSSHAPLPALPVLRTPCPGPKSQAWGARLLEAECPEVTCIEEDFPVFWERAEGCMVEDVDGNVLLDLTAAFGVAAIGHTHPEVVAAVQTQAGRLLHAMGDVHPSPLKVQLGERLATLTPGDIGLPLFATSGAEAVEAARKTCTIASGRPGLIAFSGAYHGLTYGALEATARADFRTPFAAQRSGTVRHAPYPYCYRCPLRLTPDRCELACLGVVEQMLSDSASGADGVGGVLVEPIQARGGTVVPPRGWLPALRRLCDRYGVLLILDEVFTGFGRTGAWFACELESVVPDLMAIGKAMGGGIPISACVGRKAVMEKWERSRGEALHTSTFLGNPVAAAAALASLEVMERESLPTRARELGHRWLEALKDLGRHHACVGDVRGEGLMIGIELVVDQESRQPDTGLAVQVMKEALKEGIIVLPEGAAGNVIGLSPPLTLSEFQADFATGFLDRTLRRLKTSSRS